MIFRQLYDLESGTYSYLLAAQAGGEALLIDPVRENSKQYIELIRELDLQLVMAIDTHTHADHVTALGVLRDTLGCITIMGEYTRADCVSRTVKEDEVIALGDLRLRAMYTPGHTDESFSFVMDDRVFTGDALLIRGTGRTDFQNGDPYAAYDSLFNKLLKLPDDTLVYAGHDYKGWTVSTIGEERRFNPRLQVSCAQEYAEIMNNLDLPDPKKMDIAVPANLQCGHLTSDVA